MTTIPGKDQRGFLDIGNFGGDVVLRIRVPELYAKDIHLDPAAISEATDAMHAAAADAAAYKRREDLVDRILCGGHGEIISTSWMRGRLHFLFETFALDATRADAALRHADSTDRLDDSLPCPPGMHASWWTGLTRAQQAVYAARGLPQTDTANAAVSADDLSAGTAEDDGNPALERSVLCRCPCHNVHSGRWTDD